MKSLKLHFESLLDDDDVFYDPKNDKKEIENWIRSNYRVTGRLSISKDYTVNCTGNVYSTNRSMTSLTNGLFKWGKIARNFSCALCGDLKSFEVQPEAVDTLQPDTLQPDTVASPADSMVQADTVKHPSVTVHHEAEAEPAESPATAHPVDTVVH